MTEYDFSEEGYERHLKNQSRVSNWVSSQSSHTTSYGNPFMPSAYQPTKPLPDVAAASVRPSTKASSRSRSSTVTSTAAPGRQTPVRSHTAHDAPSTERRSTPSRSRTLPSKPAVVSPQPTYPVIPSRASSPSRRPSPPTRRSSPTRRAASPTPHRSSHRSTAKSPSRSHSTSHHHQSSRSHAIPDAGRKIIQLDRDAGNTVFLPPPRHGEQYVIIPPPGGKVEVLKPRPEPNHHQSLPSKDNKRDGHKTPPANTTREESTFLRRLFGGFTGGNNNNNNNALRSRSRSLHRRRRSY